jgi:6-phosphogluconolactonase
MSKKIPGLIAWLALVGLSVFLVNCGSSSSRPAGVLYVLSQGASNVGSYAIDLGNGHLSLINSNASTCATAPCGFPESIVLDPTGANAFVLNQGVFNPGDPSGVVPSISGYTVKSDGSLTLTGDLTTNPAPPVSQACDQPPQGVFTSCDLAVAMALDASGKFLFVITQGNQSLPATLSPLPPQLIVFSVQGTTLSVLSSKNLTRVPTALASIAAPNGGILLYVSNSNDLGGGNDNTVSEFSVDATSGSATELIGSPYPAGSVPSAVVAIKTAPAGGNGGLFVYVANSGATADSVSVFQVCTVQGATCTAQDVTNATMLAVGSPASVGQQPVAMAVDPTNNFLYVVDKGSSQLSAFRINATTGALSPLTPAAVSTGATPVAVAMHSTGNFLFVSNNAGSTVSAFNINTTSGALSATSTVTSSAQPAGLAAK